MYIIFFIIVIPVGVKWHLIVVLFRFSLMTNGISFHWLINYSHIFCGEMSIQGFWGFFFFLSFLGPQVRHTEVPRLGVESELQLPAYTTVAAKWDLSHNCDLHHSSQQRQILNPLSKAKDQTRNLMVPSRICFCRAMMGTPGPFFDVLFIFLLLACNSSLYILDTSL